MDFTSDKPIYRQIIDFSFGQILTGVWTAGERVPSVRELSVQLSVNSHTILKAYEFLQAEGIIVSRRGMGFYLTADALDHVNQARRREFFEVSLSRLFNEMDLLGISIDDVIEKYRNR
ncbi:MAG: GntR family transcriptional regulator [Duncaniella sp.]|uniref:GntR family transcriptional regulator n=1 Tax=Duncaniella sp. TaxID=2518496 RepID=UPI0023CF84DC|nr:GntR family transcriptional regulator [Duncaniella sp.]MDE5989237.1 GntR family transcriptional regulator [Duncaniella sp.]MDE6174301.1 GntR family transcriptional regulator [Duncaniella sp.]